MQANIASWKRLALAAALAALPAVSSAAPNGANGQNDLDFSLLPLVNGVVTIPGSDCSGVFGLGLDNCAIPSFYDPDQSPIIVKFNTFEDDEEVLFPTPPSALIEVNSIFASITGSEFRFACNDDACLTGTWTYTPNDALDPVISFYVAKGGDNFNLFNVVGNVSQGDTQSGNWSTPLRAGLSHISFYDTDGIPDIPDQPVPEPGTLALIAAGLLGLGVAARRRRA